jgi:hypothetical protein
MLNKQWTHIQGQLINERKIVRLYSFNEGFWRLPFPEDI